MSRMECGPSWFLGAEKSKKVRSKLLTFLHGAEGDRTPDL
jgi:hypothetical protein